MLIVSLLSSESLFFHAAPAPSQSGRGVRRINQWPSEVWQQHLNPGRDPRPCLETTVCPQSYFLQEREFLPTLCPSFAFLSLKALGESAANRAVTVNSLFVFTAQGKERRLPLPYRMKDLYVLWLLD